MSNFDPMKRQSLKFCPFKKHLGRSWNDIVTIDRAYVEWLVSGEGPENLDPELEDVLIDLLEREEEYEDIVDDMYTERIRESKSFLKQEWDD